MWLADVEFKLQSVKLGNQLDRLQDDRTAALEAIASIQAPWNGTPDAVGGMKNMWIAVTPDQKKMRKKVTVHGMIMIFCDACCPK